MRNNILILICFALIAPLTLAQTNVNRGGFNTVQYLVNQRKESKKEIGDLGLSKEILAKAKGSPFEDKNFKIGKVFSEDNETTMAVMMRYNIFLDEIEIKNEEGGPVNIVNKDPDIRVAMGVDRYVYLEEDTYPIGGYFKVLNQSKPYKIYKKLTVKYVEGEEAETVYSMEKKPSFPLTETYYLVDSNNTLKELPKGKSKILQMMPSKIKELKSFIKTNKLNLKEEKDLAKLVDYFNEIH